MTSRLENAKPTTLRPRAFRRVILAPFALGVAVIVGLLLLTIPITPNELAFVANLSWLCLCALPLVLVLFLVYLVLVVVNFYLAKATLVTATQTRRAHTATTALKDRVAHHAETITQKSADLSVKTARLDVILDFFDRAHRERKAKNADSNQ